MNQTRQAERTEVGTNLTLAGYIRQATEQIKALENEEINTSTGPESVDEVEEIRQKMIRVIAELQERTSNSSAQQGKNASALENLKYLYDGATADNIRLLMHRRGDKSGDPNYLEKVLADLER